MFCCVSKTGYLYQLDLYLGKKEKTEEILGPSVVLKVTVLKILKNSYCTVFFDNFFNSPSLITNSMTEVCMELVLLERIG